jgi:hypothetical protein
MHSAPIVEEVHRIRQEMLEEFGGDADALVDDCNRRVLSGEFGDFKILTRTSKPARVAQGRERE